MNIEKNAQASELPIAASRALNKLFQENIARPILFLTSGGSSFDLLDHVKIPQDSHISVGVLDERYSLDPTINNFTQLKNTPFFQRSEKLFEHILDTSASELNSLEEFAGWYESWIRTWMVENPTGVIIATIGMGSDGHTSGMMPFPEDESRFEKLFNDGYRLVVGYDAGNKNQYPMRATTTCEFMRRIHHGVAYIVGEGKQEAWGRVVSDTGNLAQTPARILREMEDVRVFTDLK